MKYEKPYFLLIEMEEDVIRTSLESPPTLDPDDYESNDSEDYTTFW